MTRWGQRERLVVYDHAAGKVVFEVKLPFSSMANDLSPDGRFVAAGYWDRSNIDIWEIATSNLRIVKSPSQVSRAFFDGRGDWLVWQSERGTYATHITREKQLQIKQAGDLLDAAFRVRDNSFFVPLRLKGQVAKISFNPIKTKTITLPIATVIGDIEHSPTSDNFLIVDGTGCAYSYDDELRRTNWKTMVSERPFRGMYCGDGSLVGLSVSPVSGPRSVVVLDAHTGERLAHHTNRICGRVPFQKDSVLLDTVWPGRIFHLRDGSMENGFAPLFGAKYSIPKPTAATGSKSSKGKTRTAGDRSRSKRKA